MNQLRLLSRFGLRYKIRVAGNCNRPKHDSCGPSRWPTFKKAASHRALTYRLSTRTRAAEQSDGSLAQPSERGSPSTHAKGTGKGAAL